MNDLFKALSDPSRRKIIQLLKEGDLTAGEIADHFDMAKPSISHHLNLLKQANLVLSQKQGQNVIYSLNTTTLQDALSFFFDLINKEILIMKTKNIFFKSIFILTICSILLTLYFYPNLPNEIPIHFDYLGNPDNYGPRSFTFFTAFYHL